MRNDTTRAALVQALQAGLDAALDYAGTVAGGSSWWDDVWAEHAAAITAAEAALAEPSPVAPTDTQGDFEAWIAADSTLPITRDAHGYADMTTALMWHAWQAAQKANAPEGALVGGGSTRDAGPGLAEADHSCAHDFAMQPSSGIKLCAHCGLSEVAARKRAAPAPVAPRQPLTREAVKSLVSEAGYGRESPACRGAFIDGLRRGERAHGIGQEGGAA